MSQEFENSKHRQAAMVEFLVLSLGKFFGGLSFTFSVTKDEETVIVD
jgi:hypothetical protein